MTDRPEGVSEEPLNHRTRVAFERREKTRARLVKAALQVFAGHGVDAKVIDLVIRAAQVSRGTFYNYFRTNEELFIAVAEEVSNEIIRVVDPVVRRQDDPAARIACGVSSVVRLAKAYPIFAAFVVRGGPPALSAGSLATEVVPRDIAAGIASGRFSIDDEGLAFGLILGPVVMAFHAILTVGISPGYPQALAQAVLQSLGVEAGLARQYATQDFGAIELAADSLFRQAPPASPIT